MDVSQGSEPRDYLKYRDLFLTEPDTSHSEWLKHVRSVSIVPTGDRDSNGHYLTFDVKPTSTSKTNHKDPFLKSWPWTIGVRDDTLFRPCFPMFPVMIDGQETHAVTINTGNADVFTPVTDAETDGPLRYENAHVTVISRGTIGGKSKLSKLDSFLANVEIVVPPEHSYCSNITLNPHPGGPGQADGGRSYHDMDTLRQQIGYLTVTTPTAVSALDKKTDSDPGEGEDHLIVSCECYRLLNGNHGSQGPENEWDEASNQERSSQVPKDHNEYIQCTAGRQVQMITLEMKGGSDRSDSERADPPLAGILTWYSRPSSAGEVTTRVDLLSSNLVGHEVGRV